MLDDARDAMEGLARGSTLVAGVASFPLGKVGVDARLSTVGGRGGKGERMTEERGGEKAATEGEDSFLISRGGGRGGTGLMTGFLGRDKSRA